jgi:glycine dehydrogenase subunit 2
MPEPGGRASSSPLLGGTAEPTLDTLSSPGRRAWSLPELDVPAEAFITVERRKDGMDLPQVSEHDLVMHFTRLAHRNFAVDVGAYPLGSCTMKYNPKVADRIVDLSGFRDLHPDTPPASVQGALEVLVEAERILCELTGMYRASFQPAAGAAGELTGMMITKAYHVAHGNPRSVMLVPDSAHGTNPASAALSGYTVREVPSNERGMVDLDALKSLLSPEVAGLMLTNPNTLGLFEEEILDIADAVHEVGGLLYYDGANLNAILGVARPGDMGFDIVHSNLHKTFATPHGGGGPGSGPVAVTRALAPYLPGPLPVRDADGLRWEMPSRSIGRVHGRHGNFGVVVRAVAYMRALGGQGLRRVAERSVLNARYLASLLSDRFEIPYPAPCMHEFVASTEKIKADTGVHAMDVVKALLDKGFHAPTMYFPLIVPEALMFEPTETQSRETMEALADAVNEIGEEVYTDAEAVENAPVRTPVHRPDDALAARHLDVSWTGE